MAQVGVRAGFWRRLLALIVDSIVLAIVNFIIIRILDAITHGATASNTATGWIELLIGLVYFTWLWAQYGQSVGYRVLGMRLTTTSGQSVGVVRAAIRYILIEISFGLFFIPAIISAFMIGLSGSKQAIHDKLMDTIVVET